MQKGFNLMETTFFVQTSEMEQLQKTVLVLIMRAKLSISCVLQHLGELTKKNSFKDLLRENFFSMSLKMGKS